MQGDLRVSVRVPRSGNVHGIVRHWAAIQRQSAANVNDAPLESDMSQSWGAGQNLLFRIAGVKTR